MGEKIIFLRNFIKKPRQIGSIIPSSKKLSEKMAEQINYQSANTIVELGPGTGPYTKLILDRKKEQTRYIAFEKNNDMKKILKNKFNGIEIYSKAEEMTDVFEKNNIKDINYIISGLPFTVLEKNIRESILEQIYNNLEVNGKFITYQYSLDLYKYLKQKYANVKIKFIPINIPMAYIYICTK